MRWWHQLDTGTQVTIALFVIGAVGGVAWWAFQQFFTHWRTQPRLSCRVRCNVLDKEPSIKKELIDLDWQQYITPNSAIAELTIKNSGKVEIRDITGRLRCAGAKFVTAGWIPNVADDYHDAWEISQSEEAEVNFYLTFLNPNDTFLARFLLDTLPTAKPSLVLNVPGVTVERKE
jgi:hypothetical protein